MGTRARFEPGERGESSVKLSDLLCPWLPGVRTFLKSSILMADSRYLAFKNTHSDDINSNLIGLVLRRSGQLQASLLELAGDHTAFKSSYAVTWQERLHPECTRNRVATASLRKNRRGSVTRKHASACFICRCQIGFEKSKMETAPAAISLENVPTVMTSVCFERISGKICSVYGADPSLWFEMSDF
jgi:hypothetical protein